MSRLALIIGALALNAYASTALADLPPDPPTPPDCVIESRTYDSRDVACSVSATSEQQHFLFKANFSGGHDDTNLIITPLLDGQPLKCDAGSKTTLFGEDGDVSVWCAFQAPNPKVESRLKVKIHWSHAEYTNFEFGAR